MKARVLNKIAPVESSPLEFQDSASLLAREREIKSEANITRSNVLEFLPLAAAIPLISEINEFKLEYYRLIPVIKDRV